MRDGGMCRGVSVRGIFEISDSVYKNKGRRHVIGRRNGEWKNLINE